MSQTNTSNLQFSFTFYYNVFYLGHCADVADPNKYGKPMSLPEKWQQIPILCLTLIAFIINAITLFIFLFGEFTINRIASSSSIVKHEKQSGTTSSIISKTTQKPKKHSRSRSSFLTSLIILSLFEVIFNFSAFIFKLIEISSPNFIHQIPIDSTTNHKPPDMRIIVIPVVQNVIMFLADIGLMCRNWCICLITAARAEVVIWPLGSKAWQRILRNPRRFTLVFMIFVVISIVISAFKHTDYIGHLCYDQNNKKYGLWSVEYLWSYEGFSKYMTFIVLPYQAVIPWFIIVIFTMSILFGLKPWKTDDKSILFSHNTKSLDDLPDLQKSQQQQQQQSCVQQDALRKRQQGQLRATQIVLIVAVLFGLLECMNFIVSICQTAKLLTNHRLSRILETIGNTLITLDSMCNFVVFISMMSYFRQIFAKIFLCHEINQNSNVNNINNSTVSQKITSSTSINQTSTVNLDKTNKLNSQSS
ncbi:unnamed protein product [Schistosoma turkestanicum]|nr:unnamed protein product [Schistosoma turkestanicum]